jgi:hypothetical protein
MMKKSKVYWSHNNRVGFNDVVGYPPERLLSYMKKDPLFRDTDYGLILSCPATLDLIRNTYVLRYPISILNTIEQTGEVYTHPMGIQHPRQSWTHLHMIAGWYFFSATPMHITVTPPYLHPQGLVGPAATFDISKWFRMVHASIMVRDKPVEIKRGQPVLYVTFDKPVDLLQFDLTYRLSDIADKSAAIKHTEPRLSLEYLYNKFKQNKTNKIVLDEIKRNLL